MAVPQWGTAAQTRVLEEYARGGSGSDDSYGRALAEADGSGEGVGSGALVCAWRRGTRQSMTLGAFDVLLEHVDPAARASIVDAFLRPHGLRAAPLDLAETTAVNELERRALRIGGAAGSLLHEIANALEDGVIDGPEAKRLAGCLRTLVGQAHPLLDQLEELARGRGPAGRTAAPTLRPVR